MSKINVYSSSASYAIKVFDTNSTGLKPDNAILVTTGSDPTNAIQINVGEKQDDYIAVTFAGGEPGPTPPEPSDTHTITISPSINGSVSATPIEGVSGTIVTLSNTPDDYCTFVKYNITGAELTGNTFEIGDSDIDVQGVFVADQYNVSYTNDGHGSLTGTLTTATGGMTTTLTAVPNTHYNLGDITVTGGTVNGKVLTVTSNCTANASYVPKQYTVTYQNNGYGTLTGGVTTATGNSTTTLTATPNNHYSLANYTVTGGTISGNTLTITADCTAKANFAMIQPYTLTLQQTTGGTIGSTKNTGYSGDTTTLSYTPAADYTFGSWSVTGGTISGNTFTFGNSNATAKATFNNYVPNRSISASKNWAYTNGRYFNYYNHNANNNKFSLSGLNQQNFIIAVHYKFGSNTTENPMNVMLDVNTLPDGWYLNWNTATNKWSTPANWVEAAEFPYMSNRKTTTYSGNSSLMPIFQYTNYVRNDSVWKANDVTMYGDKLVYPVNTSWIKDYDIKYLIEQKYPVVTNHYPERSMFLSAYVNNQLKVSAYGGMQFTTVSSYHFGAGVYYSGGTTSNPKCSAYDGSASYTAGYFNAGRINDAYNWLMSI